MTKTFDDFLDAYAVAEKELRKRANARIGESLAGIIRDLAKRDRLVKRHEQDLLVFHKLRNVIVHERRDGQPIADPLPSAVEAFKRIAEILVKPPRIERFAGETRTVAPSDMIGVAAAVMAETGFSQLPVVDQDHTVGLLTAETVVRWYAASLDEGLVADASVADALPHTEDQRHMRLVARSALVDHVIELFERSATEGFVLDALVITHSGKSSEKPIGIITASDLPELHAAL